MPGSGWIDPATRQCIQDRRTGWESISSFTPCRTRCSMSLFEFFFKYRPIVYEKGRLTFQLLASRWMFIPLALVAIAVAIYFYQRVAKEKLSLGMIVLRSLVFIILLFMFLQPVMNVSQVLPQDSYMAVVVDTSQSMNIKDDGETSRAQMMLKKMEETKFIQELSKKFKVRMFVFNREAQRIEDRKS